MDHEAFVNPEILRQHWLSALDRCNYLQKMDLETKQEYENIKLIHINLKKKNDLTQTMNNELFDKLKNLKNDYKKLNIELQKIKNEAEYFENELIMVKDEEINLKNELKMVKEENNNVRNELSLKKIRNII